MKIKDPIHLYNLSEGSAKVMLVLVLQESPSERHFMCEYMAMMCK